MPLQQQIVTGPVAIITATDLATRDSGKKVVLGGMIDHFCDRLGPGQVHVVLAGPAGAPHQPVAHHLHVLDRPSPPEQVWSLAWRVAARRQSSLQEAALHSPRLARSLAAMLDDIDPQLEVWDTIRLGQYAPLVRRRRRVLYLEDLYSKRYASMLELNAAGGQVDPLGAFGDQLPGVATRVVASPRTARRLLDLERRLAARSEERQPAWFDASILVSAAEAAALRQRTGLATIRTLQPIVPSPPLPTTRRRGPGSTFAFLGALFYGPNSDGLRWFLTACRDEVLRAVPDFQLLVIGRGSEVCAAEAAAWHGRVELLGWVDDLDGVLAQCTALVAPLRVGSGVKLKVLEALARGLPVVATPMGVQGLGVGEPDGCLVASEPAELAAALARAAQPADNEQLSASASRAWRSRFCPDVAVSAYDELFGLRSPVGIPA